MAATLPVSRLHDAPRPRPAQPAPAARRRQARSTDGTTGRNVRSLRHVAPETTPTKPTKRVGRAKPKLQPTADAAARRASRSTARPQLRMLRRPRVAINLALLLVGIVVSLMLATVVLHTRLAERQLEIDRLETSVTDAKARFDVLRQQRAELRAPSRLAAASAELGMGEAPPTEFLPVDPFTVAEVLIASGPVDADGLDGLVGTESLGQVRRAKAVATTDATDAADTEATARTEGAAGEP